MKKSLFLFSVLFVFLLKTLTVNSQQRVVISDKVDQTADPSAVLELISDNKGFLLPRMNSSDRESIDSPAESLMIFNTETKCIDIHIQGEWYEFWCIPELADACEGVTPPEIDGKTYEIIGLGTQCWFRENLNVGERIDAGVSQGTDCTDIKKYCYQDNEANCDTYGGLYHWDMAMCGETDEGSQGVCPDGWRMPTHDDWTILERFICNSVGNPNCEDAFPFDEDAIGSRGTDEASRIAGSSLWTEDNLVNNPAFIENSDFYALPAGNRGNIDYNRLTEGTWWLTSSTNTDSPSTAWTRYIMYDSTGIKRHNYEKSMYFFSVRCVKE